MTAKSDRLVLAFFGRCMRESSKAAPFLSFMSWAQAFAAERGLSLTNFNCAPRSGVEIGLKENKNYRLKTRARSLEREIDRNAIRRLSLQALGVGDQVSPAFDWDINARLAIHDGDLVELQLGVCHQHLECADLSEFLQVAEQAVHAVKDTFTLCYGFAVSMPRDFFPSGYVSGLPGMTPSLFKLEANLWRSKYRLQCDSHLRNVYGVNFLGSGHLNIHVRGKPLGSFISETEERGRLKTWLHGLHLWDFGNIMSYPDMLEWNASEVQKLRDLLLSEGLFAWAPT